ncbi:N-acetyltransferase [Nocardioides solisilvae]|uniref:N-acetyltransferase n=1 Tax=Nocardioides solisilvae TaxID=1542435 RepID=UPI000D748C2F|nr:N-acetyltransferase [Nocardioides solisilvae]
MTTTATDPIAEIVTLAERPGLMDVFWTMPDSWPEFMKHDPIGNVWYDCLEQFAEFVLVCLDADGQVAAKAYSAPFALLGDDGDEDDVELPPDGWDGVVRRALRGRVTGEPATHVSAIEIVIRPELQGLGLSGRILAALRDNAGRLGFAELLAPVRPNGKQDAAEPMSSYAFRTRDDGLPVDPWLRVHVRAGGRIDRVAPRSMTIPGTLAEWRAWTGLPFDRSGPVVVPGALTPVLCDVEHGTAVYVEPNVWVRHPTGA